MAAHAAALIFGAFWLVATTPREGPRDCFTGISNPTRLEVVLGPSPAGDPDASCGGLDGLAPGSTLVFDLSQTREDWKGVCQSYDTDALAGTSGVDIGRPAPGAGSNGYLLTAVTGGFAWPEQPVCRSNNWWLWLSPETEPAANEMISPLDAGSGQPWFVERGMAIEDARPCGATFTAIGPRGCVDRFSVVSITEVAAP